MPEYMGTKQASEKWGLKQSYISELCRKGKIRGVQQDVPRSPWRIPVDTPNPKKTKII